MGSNAAFRAHYTGYHKVSEAKVTNVDFMTLNYGLTSLYNFTVQKYNKIWIIATRDRKEVTKTVGCFSLFLISLHQMPEPICT